MRKLLDVLIFISRHGKWVMALLLLLLALLPLSGDRFFIYLITQTLIICIFALAYDIVFGYTGLLSLGHSVFFGVPPYIIGIIACTKLDIKDPFVLIGAALAAGVVLGAVMGFFATFTRGIYLVMVTFSFAQIFTLLILSDPGGFTLGENGIVGLRPHTFTLGGSEVNLFRGTGLYYLVLVFFVLTYLSLRALIRSQIGAVLIGIRENENRLIGLGFNTRTYKVLAFIISAVFSALAGALWAFLNNSITPATAEWEVGAEILLMVILGGPGTPIGPVVGSFLVNFAESYASSWVGGGNWLYVMGGLYIFVVMVMPGGIFNSRFFEYIRNQRDMKKTA